MENATAVQTLMTTISGSINGDMLYTSFNYVVPVIAGVAGAVIVYKVIKKIIKNFVNKQKLNA